MLCSEFYKCFSLRGNFSVNILSYKNRTFALVVKFNLDSCCLSKTDITLIYSTRVVLHTMLHRTVFGGGEN